MNIGVRALWSRRRRHVGLFFPPYVFLLDIYVQKNILDIYVRSMLYAYTSKQALYFFADALQSAVFRCDIAVAAGAAAAAAALHRLVCVYGYDCSSVCDYPRF